MSLSSHIASFFANRNADTVNGSSVFANKKSSDVTYYARIVSVVGEKHAMVLRTANDETVIVPWATIDHITTTPKDTVVTTTSGARLSFVSPFGQSLNPQQIAILELFQTPLEELYINHEL